MEGDFLGLIICLLTGLARASWVREGEDGGGGPRRFEKNSEMVRWLELTGGAREGLRRGAIERDTMEG